ncbi:unnamed protein product [marine sediment metagenome]|uniref:Treble clef zinc finger domain-containing protein n=1 Tax=marine sediment metagenome TaxID=412755 RepID=X1A2T2_9ZZZZ
MYPKIAKEWHPTKNDSLKPEDITAGSEKKFWWKCPEELDHEWEASVRNRTHNKSGCPYCVGRKVSVANSLASLFPSIAKQWHPTKNGSLKPEQVVAGSNTKVWWKCVNGPDHEWEAQVNLRTGKYKSGCPCCSGRKPSVTNSLASLFPSIAKQWHPTKNKPLTPEQVTAGTCKKYWWKCPEEPDHEWEASVRN